MGSLGQRSFVVCQWERHSNDGADVLLHLDDEHLLLIPNERGPPPGRRPRSAPAGRPSSMPLVCERNRPNARSLGERSGTLWNRNGSGPQAIVTSRSKLRLHPGGGLHCPASAGCRPRRSPATDSHGEGRTDRIDRGPSRRSFPAPCSGFGINSHVVLAHISGKMRKELHPDQRRRLRSGQHVPYDLRKARITFRQR